VPAAREPGQPVRAACRYHYQGGREVQYGHKAQLGHRPQRPDPDVVRGGRHRPMPSVSYPMLERQIAVAACPPRQSPPMAACQSGQSHGGQDARRQGCRLPQEAAAWRSKTWSRAAGSIASCALPRRDRGQHLLPQRAYGLARCTWRGLDHFPRLHLVRGVAHNLVLLGRLKPA